MPWGLALLSPSAAHAPDNLLDPTPPQLCRRYGDDARMQVLLCLLEEVDVRSDTKVQKEQHRVELLSSELVRAVNSGRVEALSSVLATAASQHGEEKLTAGWLSALISVTKLPFAQQLLLLSAMAALDEGAGAAAGAWTSAHARPL